MVSSRALPSAVIAVLVGVGSATAALPGTQAAAAGGQPSPPSASAGPVPTARAHLDRLDARYAPPGPGGELALTRVIGVPGGDVVRFRQRVDGLPVVGGQVAVSVGPAGGLQSVNGETTDPGAATPAPSEPAASAARTALLTTARTHRLRPSALTASAPRLWLYDPELIGSGDPLGTRPVWRVEVTDDAAVDQVVLVDAATGHVAQSVNQVTHALNRVVCDRARADGSLTRRCVAGDAARTENDAATGDADVDAAFAFAGDTSELFAALGRDLTGLIGSPAGDGARRLRLTVNLPGENAAWNGREAYFSTGFAQADDVVAHELAHGVIDRLSGLAYWYQSGAINESIADVFGEIVDQRNGVDGPGGAGRWRLGEDAPIGTLRSMQNPPGLRLPRVPRQPDRMRSRFYYAARGANDNGGVHINSGVGNKAAYLIAEGGRFNGVRIGRGVDEGSTNRINTARIYLRVLPMLTSGSDYADLGRLLPQACRALVARTPITAADCRTVRRAVTATEMLSDPRRAAAPEAPHCTPRNARTRRLFSDNMEGSLRAWRSERLWMRFPTRRVGGLPFERYATSGRRSLLGLNPDPTQGTPRTSSLTLRRAVRVPAGGRTFVRFDHSRFFEHVFRTRRRATFFDGGRVEYSLDGGRRWTNAARLRWVNGPRQRIEAGRGFRGFGGDSHGWQSSRLELTRLAGRTVRLRWTVEGDANVAFLGWWLDDVEAYTCRPR